MKHSLITPKDLSREDIESLLRDAARMKTGELAPEMMRGRWLAQLFYENSTRTRLSHEAAALRLGMSVTGFAGTEGTSVQKGESLADTITTVAGYQPSVLVLRHGLDGSAQLASETTAIPVINAGDGKHSHPTQTLLDLMTIQENSTIDGCTIALVGDLKYGRTVHSLIEGLGHFEGVDLYLVSPKTLRMPRHYKDEFKARGNRLVETESIEDVLDVVHVVYMTRIQKERFPSTPEGQAEYRRAAGALCLTAEMVGDRDIIVMHPLPRDKRCLEIAREVDDMPHARYAQQSANGMYVRQALLYHMVRGHGFHAEQQKHDARPLWKDLTVHKRTSQKEEQFYTFANGTLLDHLPPGSGERILQYLSRFFEGPHMRIGHLPSTRYQCKDVVGFFDTTITGNQQCLQILGLVAPQATVNVIKDGRVTRKGRIELSGYVNDIPQCSNVGCITRPEHQEGVSSRFYVEPHHDELTLRCCYCDIPQKASELKLNHHT